VLILVFRLREILHFETAFDGLPRWEGIYTIDEEDYHSYYNR